MLALRVVARWQKRIADIIGNPHELIQKFEGVVDWLAYIEKDLPRMQEAEQVWNTEAKLWSYEDLQRLRAEGNPKYKQINEYRSNLHDFVMKVKFSSQEFQRVQAQFLFLGILQQYDLQPKVRKSIEAAAKYHGSRRKSPSREDALEVYMKMMATVRGQLAAAKDALAHGKPRGSSSEGPSEVGELRAGPFRVVNTGGFDDKTMAEVQAVTEKSVQLLQAKGLGRVCYGDMLVSRTLSKQNVLAFYLPSKDEMFVRANLRGKQHDAVATICHELGHRLQFKFLAPSKNREIQSIYAQIARKTNWVTKKEKIQEVLKDHPVLPGETYIGKANAVYEVTGTGFDRGGLTVKLQRKDNPAYKAQIALDAYLIKKGLLTQLDVSGFITAYATTNSEENFAEMISAWCLDKLPEDQVELLKTVL